MLTHPKLNLAMMSPTPPPRRPDLFRFVLALFGVVLAELVLCALIPEDAVPEHLGFPLSCLAALIGFGSAAVAAQNYRIRLPIPVTLVVLVAAAKIVFGTWLWGTYFYDLDSQYPLPGFALSPTFHERQSDVRCLLEIIEHWNRDGISYIGKEESYISINNRPPAHLAALVIRAYGKRYHSYFPFAALITGLGALAMMAAALGSGGPHRSVMLASWLAVLWPFSLHVGSVMKDTTLSGFVMLCAALLFLGQSVIERVIGVGLSLACIPLFRPAYALACLASGVVGAMKGRTKRFGVVVVGGALLGGAVVAERILQVSYVMTRHVETFDPGMISSKVQKIPVIGQVIYAFGTPFPWVQIFDDDLKLYMVFSFVQQVITLAMVFMVSRSVLSGRSLPPVEAAVALAGGMVGLGVINPTTSFAYVHVGVVAALPYLSTMGAWSKFRSYIAIALGCFMCGNALWLLVR